MCGSLIQGFVGGPNLKAATRELSLNAPGKNARKLIQASVLHHMGSMDDRRERDASVAEPYQVIGQGSSTVEAAPTLHGGKWISR